MAKKITKSEKTQTPQEIPALTEQEAMARVSALAARLSKAQDPRPQSPVSSEPDRPRNVTIPVPPLSMD